MEPFTDTNTLPLSIAQISSHPESGSAPASDTRSDTATLALHDRLLAAVVTRMGEVEAAEWALDQAKAACQVQLAAALSSGVPVQRIAQAAGICASVLVESIGKREPVAALG